MILKQIETKNNKITASTFHNKCLLYVKDVGDSMAFDYIYEGPCALETKDQQNELYYNKAVELSMLKCLY